MATVAELKKKKGLKPTKDQLNVVVFSDISGNKISVINSGDLEQIIQIIDDGNYQIVIIDSIQTISSSYFDSPPGTVGQIRESAARLIDSAKKGDHAIFLIGRFVRQGVVKGRNCSRSAHLAIGHLVLAVPQHAGARVCERTVAIVRGH